MISRFVANSEKCCKYTFLGGSAQIITILHREGYRNLLQYYMGRGSLTLTGNEISEFEEAWKRIFLQCELLNESLNLLNEETREMRDFSSRVSVGAPP